MGGNVADLTILISAGSLLVAIIALVVSIVANKKTNAARQRLVEIEEQREKVRQKQMLSAQLHAELRKTGSSRLAIINKGYAEARNLRVTVDGRLLLKQLPDVVGANSEVSCPWGIYFGCSPHVKIELKWDDDSGNDREYRTTLTF